MTFAWHIAKKDYRLQRSVVAGWIVLSLLTVADRLIAPVLARDPHWQSTVLPPWLFTIGLSYFLVLLLGTANIIQADRLVGTTAFWLTRPIPRGTLLRAKLLGLFLFIIVPSLAIEAVLLMAFRVSATTIAAALLQQAWTLAVFMLVIVFGAALTSTIVRLLLTIVGVLLVLYFAPALVFVLMSPPAAAEDLANWRPPDVSFDPTALVIGTTIFAIGALAAIGYQYWQRRWRPAVAIFVAAIVVTWLTYGLWRQTSLFGGEPVIDEPWARDPAISRVHLRTVDSETGRPLPAAASQVMVGDRRKGVFGPIVLDGVPPGYEATPYTIEATVEFADGSSQQSWTYGGPSRQVSLESPDSEAASNGLSRTERWSSLINVDDKAFQERGAQPARYTGTFYFALDRTETLAKMPLTVGASYNDGVRSVLVDGLRQGPSGCVVSLRTTSVGLLGQSLSYPELVVRYHRRDGAEMVDPSAPLRRARPSQHAASRYDAIPASLLHTFDLDRRDAYPLPTRGSNLSVGPPCEEITLEVERVRYAGHLTRTLELHDFRLNDPFANATR
jgi:ABC-type transport system involved in multi-copper enzyme maturation permease subunit